MKYKFISCFFAISSVFLCVKCLNQSKIPQGFIYLREVDPSIVQEMRYSTFHNFVGHPISGYLADECILTIPAAMALRNVQKELSSEGFSLKVYDCYRPMKAVTEFYNWSQDISQQQMKEEFYSDLDKKDLFDLGYIAKSSGHCRGSTMDLTIVPLPLQKEPEYHVGDQLEPCYAPYGVRFPDRSIDMGTGFDCFNTLANTDDPRIIGIEKDNRQFLKSLMTKFGFKNLDLEWWHYTLINEPFPDTYFDFDILPYSEAKSSDL